MEWNHRRFLCFLRNKDVPLYYATTIMLPYRSSRPGPPPPPVSTIFDDRQHKANIRYYQVQIGLLISEPKV